MMPVISGDAIFARNQTDAASSFCASIQEIFSLRSFRTVGLFDDLPVHLVAYKSATVPAKSGTVGRSLALSLRIMLGGTSSGRVAWSIGLSTGWSWVRIPLQQFRFGTLAIPLTLLCLCLSEEALKLLSGVYAGGSKISHQSAVEMCNLSWTPHSSLEKDNSLNHSSVSPKMDCLEYTSILL